MRRPLALAAGLVLCVALVFAGVLGTGALLGERTRYCPLSHYLSDMAACRVLDSQGERVLVQHADLDANEYYLEIVSPGSRRAYALPAGITALAPRGYVAKLVSGEPDSILLDGTPQRLVPLDEPR